MMGIGVGGMLPIAFALMAETIPARHRGRLIAMNHWIPESPRYLMARGRHDQAEAIMARYGAVARGVSR